jgi:hypothetical protein
MNPNISGFPSADDFEAMAWAPILFQPILGSKEQFIVGIAAASSRDCCLVRANMLDRLNCFYTKDGEFLINLIETALDELERDLRSRGKLALVEYSPSISGILIGDIEKTKGPSCQEVATAWISAMSSLYARGAKASKSDSNIVEALDISKKLPIDNLPREVLTYVKGQYPALEDYFSEAVKNKKARNKRSGINVDYSSSRIVVNFCTLSAKRFLSSTHNIKTRLWDLSASHDSNDGFLPRRAHEIILKWPHLEDSELTRKQVAELSEAVDDFKSQSIGKGLGVVPLHTVEEIGDYLLEREKAA